MNQCLYVSETRWFKSLTEESHDYLQQYNRPEEVEVVLRVNSSTWVGLGWRPKGRTRWCQNFPSPGFTDVKNADELVDHPMDCTDIIIGRARGFYSKV